MTPYYENPERLQEWKKRIPAMTRDEEVCYDHGHADGYKLGTETAIKAYGCSPELISAELLEAAKEVLVHLSWDNMPDSVVLRLRAAIAMVEL